MSRQYVDNAMNRQLGRVGLPMGSAVHSRNSSFGDGCSSSSFGSHKTYVDNSMNRNLGRVGMEHGTAVHSRSDRSSGSPAAHMTMFDSPGLGFMTPLSHFSHDRSSSSSSGSHKTYVDNSLNRKLDRVGMEHGTAVHSRSDKSSGSPAAHKTVCNSPGLGSMTPHSHSSQDRSSSSSSGSHKTYVDNSMNRKLGRVGMEHGTAVHSSPAPEQKVNVSNASDHKHKRDGMTLRSAAASNNKKVYKDTPFNRKIGRVGKPLGSHVVGKKKLGLLANHFDEHSEEEVPAELNNVPQDVISYVFEFMQREKAIQQLLAGRAHSLWQSENQTDFQGHTNLDEQPYTYQEDSYGSTGQPYTYQQDSYSSTGQPCTYQQDSYNSGGPANDQTSKSTGQASGKTVTEMIKTIKCREIDFQKLQMGNRIGQGGFGEVFVATFDGFIVAVKKLKSQQVTKRRLQGFINEMAVLQELNHPNIVSFVGACTVIPNLAIVMEFMDMSLYDAIHIKQVDFTDADRLEIMRGVTIGMAHLHDNNIAHCDLKTKNVLLKNVPEPDVKDPMRVKITDFGLSKMKSDMTTSTSCPSANIGTPLYAAPEILRGEMLSLDGLMKADMYSLGLLLWELALEEIPFEDLNYEQLKLQVGVKGMTPVVPENIRLDGKFHEYVRLCLSSAPNKRPTATQIAQVASTLTSLHEEGEE